MFLTWTSIWYRASYKKQMPRARPFETRLFVAKRFNRVEAGGFAGRVVTKKNAHTRGKHERDQNCGKRHSRRPLQDSRDADGAKHAENQADGPAYQAHDNCLAEELHPHVFLGGADSHAHANLASPLGNAPEHHGHASPGT